MPSSPSFIPTSWITLDLLNGSSPMGFGMCLLAARGPAPWTRLSATLRRRLVAVKSVITPLSNFPYCPLSNLFPEE